MLLRLGLDLLEEVGPALLVLIKDLLKLRLLHLEAAEVIVRLVP